MFFHMTLNIKLYHWQTKSFARHKASDELHGNLLGSIDKFIEVYIGRYDRPQFNNSFDIMVEELTDDKFVSLLKLYVKFLQKELPKYIESTDTELLNIRDDILSHFNQTLYLTTLN